jgi:hypothetical protein
MATLDMAKTKPSNKPTLPKKPSQGHKPRSLNVRNDPCWGSTTVISEKG